MTDMSVAPTLYEAWRDRLFRGDRPQMAELWDEWRDRPADWVLAYATRLFLESGGLLKQYTPAELERGLWSLPLAWDLSDLLWDRELDWAARAGCVDAMPQLFAQLFQEDPLGDTCFMWWDMFRPNDPEHDPQLRAVVFRALGEVLAIPNEVCQGAALHGLGHLNHPEKERLIRHYLADHPELDPEVVAYAEASIAGQVL